MGLRNVKEIQEYMDEASDRVWFDRATQRSSDLGLRKDILESKMANIKRIEDEYGLNREDGLGTDLNYGYWSGILAALRWVLGDEKDFLDT